MLEVTTSHHKGRRGVEIRVDSLSGDESHSWIMISNGLKKFVRDLTERTQVCDDEQNPSAGTGRPVAQSSRKQASASSSSSTFTTIPIQQRQWIDVEPGTHDSESSEIAKKMNTLLRQGSPPREEDGTIEFRRLKSMFASRFATSPYWSVRLCTRHLERRRSQKEIPVLCSTEITRYNSLPSSNPRSCRRESS